MLPIRVPDQTRIVIIAVLTLIPSLSTRTWAAPSQSIFIAARQAAARELSSLTRGRKAVVVWPSHRTRPTMIRNLATPTSGSTAEARARDFLRRHAALFDGSKSELRLVDLQTSRSRTVVRFQQHHRGLPVFGAIATVGLDSAGRVRAVSSAIEPLSLPAVQPRISAQAAVRSACRTVRSSAVRAVQSRLGILVEPGVSRLVYRVVLPLGVDPRGRLHLVDAVSGAYIGWRRGVIADRLGRLGKGVRR
jgi:Zn-dependent metalloprotease